MVEPEDSIKLLLEAFQMSVSACTALPAVAMLHEQLLGRLMLVRRDTKVSVPIFNWKSVLASQTTSNDLRMEMLMYLTVWKISSQL